MCWYQQNTTCGLALKVLLLKTCLEIYSHYSIS